VAQETIAYGVDSTHTALRMGNLANYLIEVGAYAEAQQYADQALAIMRAQSVENPGNAFATMHSAATVRLRHDDAAGAESLFSEAIALRDNAAAKPSMSVAWALLQRGHARVLQGRVAEALADFARAHPVLAEMPADSWRQAYIEAERAAIALGQADLPYDCAMIENAAATAKRQLGATPLIVLWSDALAGACAWRQREGAGLARMQHAREAMQTRLPANDARLRWLERFAQQHPVSP
jgi:tetratricopeptide (TPR) repeat protein